MIPLSASLKQVFKDYMSFLRKHRYYDGRATQVVKEGIAGRGCREGSYDRMKWGRREGRTKTK